jgi:pimeloyl-ACP methyl ester carboxylesterase
MTHSAPKPVPSAPRRRRRLRALASIVAVLAFASFAPTAALAATRPATAVRPAAAGPLPTWSGYVNSTDGVRLWTESLGGGAPNAKVVIFVHGGPGLSLTYLKIFDVLASPTRQIVLYDQRGSGQSTAPADGNYDVTAQVADLDAVRAWTGAQQITVIGHSWGGYVAAAYTALHPANVSALGLIDALPPDLNAAGTGEELIGERISTLQGEGLIPNPLPPVENNSCLADNYALTPAYLANPNNPIPRPLVWGNSCNNNTSNLATDAYVSDSSEFPTLVADLGQWQGRALVMQGADDPFGLGWSSTSVSELTSAQVQLDIVPGAGHFPWIEHPVSVLATVGQFIG